MSEEQARALMSSGLAKAELEFLMSITVPLFWVLREGEKRFRVRNGSAFFLDAGAGPFVVTAYHVIEELNRDQHVGNVVAVQIGDLPLDLAGRNTIIAAHEELDITTFRITPEEVETLGKTILTGSQQQWPPLPPQQDRGVYFGGFPGTETIWMSPREISFGALPAGGVASSISEIDVSSLIEREHLIPVLGEGIPPPDYNFGGISGGPMLSVIEHKSVRSWALAGVIYEGPNPSPDQEQAVAGLEIIRARRAHFICPDGSLDARRWADLSPAHMTRNRG
jgi:hypothetical protein